MRHLKLPRRHDDPETGRLRKVGEDWEQEFELRWRVYQYEIVTQPPRELESALGSPWPEGGGFVPKGTRLVPGGPDEPLNLRFPAPVRVYDPLEETEEILRNISRISGLDPPALLKFVNTWGVLGVGIRQSPPAILRTEPVDGVENTARWLAWIKDQSQTLYALQRGAADNMSWEDYGRLRLSPSVSQIHLAARPARHGLRPVYRVPRLVDALCLGLWLRATEERRLRRCPECRALFVPGRRNQRYCARLCMNRVNVRRWRRRRR